MLLAVNKDSLLGCNYETAASMLKKTEGLVVLTVCNPNKKDSKDSEISNIKDSVGDVKAPSRPITPKPQPSPAKEVPSDPTTCEIACNQNTLIEMKLENQPIGIQVAGGSDTLVNVSLSSLFAFFSIQLKSDGIKFQTGVVIVNIIPGSIAEKDKRLQVFDQIIDINTLKMTAELSGELIQRAVKQVQSKVSWSTLRAFPSLKIDSFQVKMTIYRADPPEVDTIDVELAKKAGKNLGLGFFTSNPRGMLVTDIVRSNFRVMT